MKVSVIVAVYNAKDSIARTMDSLLNQSLNDFEILMVDDGSVDGSSQICDDYASGDTRIRVIHQENKGVSFARQCGLDNAQGEYLIHVDADDYVELDMLERLYATASESNLDVVFCDFYSHDIYGNVTRSAQCPPQDEDDMILRLLTGLHGSCWNKLAKRSTLKKYDVRFPERLNYCEDLILWIQLFRHKGIKVGYVPKALYHYVYNTESITRKGSLQHLSQIHLFIETITKYLPRGRKEIEDYISTLPNAPFQYSFQHQLFDNGRIRGEYKRIRRGLWSDCKSIRGKVGYIMIDLNFMNIAHKILYGFKKIRK